MMIAYDLHTIRQSPEQIRKIVLINFSLAAWPADIRRCKQVESIDLRQNQLTKVPEWIEELIQLRHLHLSHNRLFDIPGVLFHLPGLLELDLSHNQLRKWNGIIPANSPLKILDASHNRLSSWPPDIFEGESMARLFLHSNPLGQFPELGKADRTLQELSLEQTRLKSLPSTMQSFRNLRVLNLANNQLQANTLTQKWPPKLERLNLCRNKLQMIPKSIKTASFLRALHVDHNNLSQLSLPPLPWLTEVTARSNFLKRVPQTLTVQNRLETLDLSDNPIRRFPTLQSAQHLRTLTLDRCPIDQLPELPPELRQLSLRHNHALTHPYFCGCPKLKVIDLGYSGCVKLKITPQNNLNHVQDLNMERTPFSRLGSEKDLLFLPNLRRLKGFGTAPDSQNLLFFLAQARKSGFTLSERIEIWTAIQSEGWTISPKQWPLVCKILASDYRPLWPVCLQQILTTYPVNKELAFFQKAGIHRCGDHSAQPLHLDQAIANLQIPISKTGIIILGHPPYSDLRLPPPNGVVEASVFWHYLHKWQTNRPLITLDDPQRLRLRHILWSDSFVNQRMALQLLQGTAGAQTFLPDLIIQWKRTQEPGIKKKIRDLLSTMLGPTQYIVFERRIPFTKPLTYQAFRQKILELTQGTPIDMRESLDALKDWYKD